MGEEESPQKLGHFHDSIFDILLRFNKNSEWNLANEIKILSKIAVGNWVWYFQFKVCVYSARDYHTMVLLVNEDLRGVVSWSIRLMRDGQVWLQLLQVKIWSRFNT